MILASLSLRRPIIPIIVIQHSRNGTRSVCELIVDSYEQVRESIVNTKTLSTPIPVSNPLLERLAADIPEFSAL